MRAALVALVVLASACAGASRDHDEDIADPVDPGAALLGGETTVFDASTLAYSLPARNLSSDLRDVFALGDHFFARSWIAAPASASGNDGLGPLFNARSCSTCHLHDGRGKPEDLLVRLSVPGGAPEPTYGDQLNPFGILGVPAEGQVSVSYEERPGTFEDGEPYSLRVPRYAFTELAYGPMAEGVMTSPRVGPPMIGLGLLEAVTDASLDALADPLDGDGDGISGRRNVGRFGWKANVTTVEEQVAGAFAGDLGMTSSRVLSETCMPAQAACLAAPNGGVPELSDQKLEAIVLYARTLAVPARRDVADPVTRRGEKLFASSGCASCHTAKLVTGADAVVPALRSQTIRPFTDLLVHDMGPDLADGRPDQDADGSEWRTPPLWGLGLLRAVSKHTFLLHDGRARDATEAILWHGGEGARAKEAFRTMSRDDRAALLAFIGSL